MTFTPDGNQPSQPVVEDPEQRQSEMTDFLKNATLFGAALVLGALGSTPWPYALDIGL